MKKRYIIFGKYFLMSVLLIDKIKRNDNQYWCSYKFRIRSYMMIKPTISKQEIFQLFSSINKTILSWMNIHALPLISGPHKNRFLYECVCVKYTFPFIKSPSQNNDWKCFDRVKTKYLIVKMNGDITFSIMGKSFDQLSVKTNKLIQHVYLCFIWSFYHRMHKLICIASIFCYSSWNLM